MIRAVLFDLDDTLFDHYESARAALERVQSCHEGLGALSLDEIDRAHSRFLEELHREVVAGRIGLDDARRERFRRLLVVAGVDPASELVQLAAATYRDQYLVARREMAGAAALLPMVRRRAKVGIVTNNLLEEQQDKLRHCGLDGFVDVLVVSEEAGTAKPDPAIFALALGRLGCDPHEAVMIGDSWSADVIGARAAGIRPIWFNRNGAPPPDGDETVAQIRSLEPPEAVLRVIFDAHRG